MSREYNEYLERHKNNVRRGYLWLRDNLPELFLDTADPEWKCIFGHDASKSMDDEYGPYDDYFYGGNRSYSVVEAFNKAWLLHIHRNPHHWQYWHSTISLELTTRTTKENDKVIKLNVYEFCQNCVEFEPQVTQRPEQLYSDFGVFCLCGDTIIECERRRHCEAIYKYLKKENEEEK